MTTDSTQTSLARDSAKQDTGTSADLGSPEVQVAILTERINNLTEHLKTHAEDFHSRRDRLTMVGRRRRLLDYVKRENHTRYETLIVRLGLAGPGSTGADQIDKMHMGSAEPEESPRVGGSIEALTDTSRADPVLLQTEHQMAQKLSEGFAEAARQAVMDAHAAGLAVPARADGIAVEIRPDGKVAAIDEETHWSPLDWKKSANR